VTARGRSQRICSKWWRGCCEVGPPPQACLGVAFNPLNLERILWLRKRRRPRRRRRRRRPRSRRSDPSPGGARALRALPGRTFRTDVRMRRARARFFYLYFCRHARACPGHPRLDGGAARKTWMAGSSPAMTRRAPPHLENYFSANASFAPSAAKPAAKLRRSQAITFGLVMTRSRTAAANRP
jgi:hypothetical protein